MKYQFKGFGKMKAISHHDLRVVFPEMNNDLFPALDWINVRTIYNDPDPEKTQQEIFFQGYYDMIILSNKIYLSDCMICIKSCATNEAPPTRPPSTSGQANISAALFAFTLPPYKIGIASAISRPCLLPMTERK